jgi:hypothetical protein
MDPGKIQIFVALSTGLSHNQKAIVKCSGSEKAEEYTAEEKIAREGSDWFRTEYGKKTPSSTSWRPQNSPRHATNKATKGRP